LLPDINPKLQAAYLCRQGFENLIGRISRLSALNPLAISITWGAGGSTKERSLDLASFTQTEYAIDTLMHLTCTNMEEGMVADVLKVRTNCLSQEQPTKACGSVRGKVEYRISSH
jgi:hypothetical protein